MDVDDVICPLIYDELAIVDVAGPYISSQCGSCGALGAAACAFFQSECKAEIPALDNIAGRVYRKRHVLCNAM